MSYHGGMGADFVTGSAATPSEGMRAIQNDLVRLGFLTPARVSGLWDFPTISAISQYQASVGQSAVPFTTARNRVSVLDSFIATLSGGRPGSTPTPGPGPTPTSSTPGPSPFRLPSSETVAAALPGAILEAAAPSNMKMYLIGGGVIALGVVAALVLRRRRA